MKNREEVVFFWFRRDLRLDDNGGLYHALKQGEKVIPLFIFDTDILDKLEDKNDRRVVFIHRELEKLHEQLLKLGSGLIVRIGKPVVIWKELIAEFNINSVYTNHDYEPYARKRDKSIGEFLHSNNIQFFTCKDQVIFEKDEVTKDDGLPYTIYTPYKNKWKAKLSDFYLKSYPTKSYFKHFNLFPAATGPKFPSLKSIGFSDDEYVFPKKTVPDKLIENYAKTRDFPGVNATSHLSVHLRFGTVSIRKLFSHAMSISDVWVNELIWREFYQQILWHFPQVVNKEFKKDYERIEWRKDEHDFQKWCDGKTGYPLVDAGMRELNATGFMHNRVRMVVSSFLTKHLLIDWRWGESYFASKLIDFELASNNGGWQWAAGTGTDAAPYFRIFNPAEQLRKFDPDLVYVKRWVPEYGTPNYPAPMVDHKFARERCLLTYKKGLGR